MALNTYRLTLTVNSGGQFAQNVLHWSFDDATFGSTHAAAKAFLIAWESDRRAIYQNMLPGAVTLLSAKCRRTSGSGGFEAVIPFVAGTTGARSGDMSASGLGPVLIGYPLDQTLRRRAKFFVAGVTDEDIVDGKYTDAFVSQFATYCGTFFDPVTVGVGGPSATNVLPANVTFPVVTLPDWVLSPNPAQMRRRQRPV